MIEKKADTKTNVDRILQKHWKFLNSKRGGERAIFDGMDLTG